jgi:hypothetical protein
VVNVTDPYGRNLGFPDRRNAITTLKLRLLELAGSASDNFRNLRKFTPQTSEVLRP